MLRWLVAVPALFCLLSAAPARAGMQEYTGTLPSGAWYHIAVPDGWQAGDAVVLYEHGLDFSVPDDPPGLGPLADVQLAEGYAVAATSYRQMGWAMFTAVADNRELLQRFGELAGAPGEIVPFGGSLGGLIALKLAEARGLPPVKGVYALCPAAAGSRAWDTAIDLRLAYDVVCENAGDLPTGDEPLPWAVNLDRIPADLGDFSDQVTLAEALVPLNQCTGINLPPYLRNDAMQQRLDRLMAFAHITDEEFFLTNMAYAIYVTADLVRAPDKLGGANPFTTTGVDYGSDAGIDAAIARISADPQAALRLRQASDFLGDVGDARVLSMHTSQDQLVIPSNQEFVRAALPADQATIAIVAEDAPTHCGFTQAEALAGWEALREWKDGAAQPDVADLQQRCEALAGDEGTDSCRFDPDAEVAPFDSLVRPRPKATLRTPSHSLHARPLAIAPIDAALAPTRARARQAQAASRLPQGHSRHRYPAILLNGGTLPDVPLAQRTDAAERTAEHADECNAIEPFYWEIGDVNERAASGSEGFLAPDRNTQLNIASASKWVYAAYVVQRQQGVLSQADIDFLTFRSGYVSFIPPSCPFADTVEDCLEEGDNGDYTPSEDGRFFYGSGHMQKHAVLLGLGDLDDDELADEIQSVIGGYSFRYSQPQLAGGIVVNADDYGNFLRHLLSGDLLLGQQLGTHAVCTNPATCASADYSPMIDESWHYSLGHWVEDDPVHGDGAFSSSGAFGFYPWIDASRSWYGIIARESHTSESGHPSAVCGRLIRTAWLTGVEQ